jgi:hypothetical protein
MVMSASFEVVFILSFFVTGLVMALVLLAWTLWTRGNDQHSTY